MDILDGETRVKRERLSFVILACALLAASCTADQVNFGEPEGLAGRKVPEPRFATPPSPHDAGPVDLVTICAPKTPPTIEGDCKTNADWRTVIYPNLKNSWNCANAGCHSPGSKDPTVDTSDAGATATWAALVAYKIGEKRYVDPCSVDPNDSAIMCNLTFSQGKCGTPMPQAQTLGAADKDAVEKWLKCGAPL